MAGYTDDHFGDDGSVTHHRHAGLFHNFRIKFTHEPSGKDASFPAILTSFTDNFSSNWEKSEYYGRMDPVAHFKSTQRTISFTISVVSDAISDALNNMTQFSMLSKFLYPTYRSSPDPAVQGGNAALINSAPLLGIQMGNLIGNAATGTRLVGYVDGFEFRPDNDATWFLANGLDNTDRRGMNPLAGTEGFEDTPAVEEWAVADVSVGGQIYVPSRFDLDVTFHVMHEHSLGWTDDGRWMPDAAGFPYNADKIYGAVPPDLREGVIIQYSPPGPKAPIYKKNKQGWLGKLFFGPE